MQTTITSVLERHTPSSFYAADPGSLSHLAAYLGQQGYTSRPARSDYEYTRLIRNGSLVILYRSGSVVVQGTTPALAIRLLESWEGA